MINTFPVDDIVIPETYDCEVQILSAILVDSTAILDAIKVLKPEHFFNRRHRLIYDAIIRAFQNDIRPDVVSVSESLKEDGTLLEAGGRTYLMELAVSHLTTTPLAYAIQQVLSKSIARGVIEIAFEAIQKAQYEPGLETLAFLQGKLTELANEGFQRKDPTLPELTQEACDEILNESVGVHDGIKTGYHGIDNLIGAFAPGQLIILAARPKMGKTALVGNIALNVALRQKQPVLFFSVEMQPVEIVSRMLKSEAMGTYRNAIETARQTLDAAPLVILNRPGLDIGVMRAEIAREVVRRGKLGLIVVDYLQIMSAGKTFNEYERITRISVALKNMAREFETPVLCLSQLSRNVETRQDKRPTLSDLRGSGSIEQDADKILFLYRDEYYNNDCELSGVAELNVAAQRKGGTGKVDLLFRGPIYKFMERI